MHRLAVRFLELRVTALARALLVTVVALATPWVGATPPAAPTLKIVDQPGGGQYVYGGLTGSGTLAEAVVYMLRQVHGHFADRPEVGKFFQTRDGGSVATFFTVTDQKKGGTPMAGLLIVSRAADGTASAAVLYDERSRFGTSEPAMMKSLAGVWQPAAAGTAARPSGVAPSSAAAGPGGAKASAAGEPGKVAHLVPVTAGDRSASVSLPDGWKLTGVAAGSLTAVGNNGEMLFLGLIYQNLPPLLGDLFANFVMVSNQRREHNGLAAGTYSETSRLNLPGNAVQVIYTVDMHDGVGLRKGSVRVGVLGPRALAVSGSNLPVALVDREEATLRAVIQSYTQDVGVINQLHQADMARLQGDADRANAQTAAINARREASSAAFNQHMGAIDKQNQAFDAHLDNLDRSSKLTQDYILDRSVVQDNDRAERGTLSNNYADSLVRANPDRFQIVPNQDLIRGLDY